MPDTNDHIALPLVLFGAVDPDTGFENSDDGIAVVVHGSAYPDGVTVHEFSVEVSDEWATSSILLTLQQASELSNALRKFLLGIPGNALDMTP